MEKLVQKFLDNRCTPEETELVLRWLETEAGETFLKKRMNKDQEVYFTSVASFSYPELDSLELLNEIKKNISSGAGSFETESTSPSIISRKHSNGYNYSILFTLAAVFLIAVVLVFNSLVNQEPYAESELAYHFVETERGEQKEIHLRDGSIVVLNHESKIAIPHDFSESNRRLKLKGEAWFEVISAEQHSFVIEASNSIVRVLGTSFAVKSHPGEESTRVVVAEGKVSLTAMNSEENEDKIIEKNQSGVFVTGKEIELENISDTEQLTGWKDGKLIFNNTPFNQVINRLERWYNVECIVLDPAIKEEHFTSVFEDEPLRQVLDVIALSMNIQYEIENQIVTFKSNNL